MFTWQNTTLDFDIVNTHFTNLGIKLTEYKDYLALPQRNISLADRCFLYTGILHRKDLEQWVANLDIHNIDVLHTQLQNIDGQYSFCLVTADTVTIGRDFFATKPIGYMISNNTLCVSSSPGVVNKLHGCHMVVPNNSIWTLSTTGKLIKTGSAYTIDYDSKCTESEYIDTVHSVVEKLTQQNVCGLPLSSGNDSGMIDSICINHRHSIAAIASTPANENKEVLKDRLDYRAKHNQKVPINFVISTPSNSKSIINLVQDYLGINDLIQKEYVYASYEIAKFFAKHRCKTALLGNGKTYLHSPFFYSKQQTQGAKFYFPDDMRLIIETPMPQMHTNNYTIHSIDCVPYLLFGIDAMHFFSDWEIIHSWIRLPADVKNVVNQLSWQGANAINIHDFIHIQQKIMDQYQYPYHNINKVGGPYV